MGNLTAPAGDASFALTGMEASRRRAAAAAVCLALASMHGPDVMAFIGLPQVDYRVYNVEQLRERQQEIIEQIVSILSISSEDALRVLRHCSW